MRYFKVKPFQRWFRKTKLSDQDLRIAIKNLESNKSCVDLGEGLYKVRIAYGNKGKSGGYRTIIANRSNRRLVFLVGYAKNEKSNISKVELSDLKDFARLFFSYNSEEIERAIITGALLEIEEE